MRCDSERGSVGLPVRKGLLLRDALGETGMPAGVERNLLAYWSVWNYEEVDISDASTDAFEELYQRSR